jgi:hypothetical protein
MQTNEIKGNIENPKIKNITKLECKMNRILKISIISKIINKIDEILCRMLEKNPFVFLTTGAIFFSSIIYLLIYNHSNEVALQNFLSILSEHHLLLHQYRYNNLVILFPSNLNYY